MSKNKKSIFIIHTSFVSVDELKKLFSEIIPEANVNNIVDDSMLPEVMKNGKITHGIIQRIYTYSQIASSLGADIIVNQCSSVGEAVNIVKKMINIPIIRIDEAMANEAVKIGKRIGVIATVASTIKPSVNIIKDAAIVAEKNVIIKEYLVEGALEILLKENNRNKHNELVMYAIEKSQKENDVLVLAQGSMTVLIPLLKDINIPVLTSPRLCVNSVKKILKLA